MKTRYRRQPLVAATTLFLMAMPAAAQSVWTGAIDDDWFKAGNWQDGAVPDGADQVNIDTSTPAPVVDGNPATVQNIFVANDAGSIMSGGRVESKGDSFIGLSVGSIGVPTVDGAGSTWLNAGDLNIGGSGNGILIISNFDYGSGTGTLIDNGLEIGTSPAGVPASDLSIQTSVAQQVNLVSLGGQALNFWDGGDASLHNNGAVDGGAGTRDVANTNWTVANGAVNGVKRPQPGFAIFQGTAGVVTVDAAAGAVSAMGLQFASNGYRLEGDALALTEAQSVSVSVTAARPAPVTRPRSPTH